MKQKTRIAIFTAIIAMHNNNLCMRKEKQVGKTIFIAKSGDFHYANLETTLKNSLRTIDGIEYNANSPQWQYETLKRCIKDGDPKYLQLCLTYKLNPNRYQRKPSLFHYAIKHCNPQAIFILSQYNPDLVPRNTEKQTPLDYADSLKCKVCITAMSNVIGTKCNELLRHQKHCGLTKHILKPGFCRECIGDLIWELRRYNLKDDYPYKTLETFLKRNSLKIDGVEHNPLPSDIQCKMLKTYIKNGALDFLRLCLQYSFDPNLLHRNSSLLHYAIKYHSSKALTILAEHNANLIATNEKGQTPLDCAILLECQGCIHAMHRAIVTKINQIVIYKKPYEPHHSSSINHGAKPKSSENYASMLVHQLAMHGLYAENNKDLVLPLFITDNPITIADNSTASCSPS